MMQNVTLLGATGSIGKSCLQVLRLHSDRYQVFALSAYQNIQQLFKQCQEFQPRYAVVEKSQLARLLAAQLKDAGIATKVLQGSSGIADVVAHPEVDSVVLGITGAVGVDAVMVAVQEGKKLLLANKEALVIAAPIIKPIATRTGAQIIPLDSEHNAVMQCLPPSGDCCHVRKITLTASGGPFLHTPVNKLANVTPAQACAHPNWSMGAKISVDSATMMNKGLERIEAYRLFDLEPHQVGIVIHPQSLVHAMVEYQDGSVLAQLAYPDMRVPIACGLAWPQRITSGVPRFEPEKLARLDFYAPPKEHFPCLDLVEEAIRQGDDFIVALNAANEVAVDAFLKEMIGFNDIPELITTILEDALWDRDSSSLEAIRNIDTQVRQFSWDRVYSQQSQLAQAT